MVNTGRDFTYRNVFRRSSRESERGCTRCDRFLPERFGPLIAMIVLQKGTDQIRSETCKRAAAGH